MHGIFRLLRLLWQPPLPEAGPWQPPVSPPPPSHPAPTPNHCNPSCGASVVCLSQRCICVAGENWVAANKVGCDAHVDPRLGSPIMQAPSFTGDGAGRFSELGATVESRGPHSNGNKTPAVHTSQSSKQSDANRSAAVSPSSPPPPLAPFIAFNLGATPQGLLT